MSTALLKLQIGPVQDFIAQARSTRDLWSGSYLLSWLMAVGLRYLKQSGVAIQIIYPHCENQPMLKLLAKEQTDSDMARVPSLPNVLLAIVSGSESEANTVAKDTAKAIRTEWGRIANEVWDFCNRKRLPVFAEKPQFDARIQHFPSIAWKITPSSEAPAGD